MTKRTRINFKRAVFWIATLVVALILILLFTAIFFPDIFLVIINILWIILFGVMIIFLVMGVLVLFGMKNQVKDLLTILLDGSLSIIEVLEFIDTVVRRFIKLIKDFLLFITPLFSFALATALYLFLLVDYKSVGKTNEVTVLTIVLTSGLVLLAGVLTAPRKQKKAEVITWLKQVRMRFGSFFNDSLEVVILVFFLTMDAPYLFFLPAQYNNVELKATFNGVNMMERGTLLDDTFKATLTLIILTILIEIIRNSLKVLVLGIKNYREGKAILDNKKIIYNKVSVFKLALQHSFKTSADEFIKFISYTTFIIFVFILFPRLKLLTLVVASFFSLVLDLLITSRIKFADSSDLLSRIIVKIFRL
ncbi:MAG TPA: hypothetical protein VJC17_03555 [Candidatus Dojkabacteria bacterium]|nr:hypothetical protein [Candidatus Dojkabacteria bacterium]